MDVLADKSTNLYKVSREHYENLLQDNIMQTYKRASPGAKRKIDKESKQFAKHLGIDDRMECYSDQHAFITLKDHKDNFKNNPKSRLINPSKGSIITIITIYIYIIYILSASVQQEMNFIGGLIYGS